MKENIEAINGFRGVAFCVIFLSHAGVIWHDFGACSVSFFLVLSGFITFYAHQGEDMKFRVSECFNFAYKKVKRMYPLHLVMLLPALIIQVALVYTGKEIFSIVDFLFSLIPNVFLFHTWFPINRIYFGYNGVAWYLSTYVFLCFMFPLLFRVMRRWSVRKALFGMGICIIVPLIISSALEVCGGGAGQYREWLLYVFPPVRLFDYFAGMQIAWLFCNERRKMRGERVAILQICVITASIMTTKFLNDDYQGTFILRILNESIIVYMPIAVFGIYLLAQNQGIVNRCLKSRSLLKLGKASMYAFLIHYLVLQYTHIVMTNFISEKTSTNIICVISAFITTGLTWLYIKVAEKRSSWMRGKRYNKRVL